MKLYRIPGAVHGYTTEFYRLIGRNVEFLRADGHWVPSRMTVDVLLQRVACRNMVAMPWCHYEPIEGGLYRIAGPFAQVWTEGVWKDAPNTSEIVERLQKGMPDANQ